MLLRIKRSLLAARLAFWKRFEAASQSRKHRLANQIEAIKKREELALDAYIDAMVREANFESEPMRMKLFSDYWKWKAAYLKHLKATIGMCEKCGRTGENHLTIDHIIPQAILKSMGIEAHLDRETKNLRLLCRICNTNKGHFLDFTDKRTKPLLLMYLKMVEGPEEFPKPDMKVSMVERWKQKFGETSEEKRIRQEKEFWESVGTKVPPVSPTSL